MDADRPALPAMPNGALPYGRDIDAAPPGYPHATFDGAPTSDWHRYLTAVRRHKKLVLLVTVVGTALGVFAARYIEPSYRARSVLWVDVPSRPDERTMLADEHVVESTAWTELVLSNAVLDGVVRELRLFVEPRSVRDAPLFANLALTSNPLPGEYRLTVAESGGRYELGVEDGPVLEAVAPGQPVGAAAGFRWTPPATLPPGRVVRFRLLTPYEAASELGEDLRVDMDVAGNWLTIQLDGHDPQLTAATVNAVAHRVVALAADLKRARLSEVTHILGEQHRHAQSALHAAESALRDFRTSTTDRLGTYAASMTPGAGGGPQPIVTRSIELQLDREQIQRDRAAIQQALAGGGAAVSALAVVPAVQQSPELMLALDEVTKKQAELRALRTRYTEASAPVLALQAQIDSLQRVAIPRLAGQLVADLNTRDSALAPRVDSAFQYLRQVPSIAMQEARLARDVANKEALFASVRERYDAMRLALLSSLPDLRILDAAVAPWKPVRDLAPLLIVLSFVTSLGLSVFGVTILDRVDSRVRYPEQITHGMRLDILGVVPHAWPRSVNGGETPPEVIESLRGLRMRVLHAHGTDEPLALTVSSPAAGEGKSFISMNLALSFAYAGYDTLLIDGDVRRGVLHRVLDVARRPGLTDVLVGNVDVEEAIRTTAWGSLSFLSAGTWMQRAPELLLSNRLRELMTQLRSRFSVIIMDSPPLLAGTDPLVLSTVTGKLMLVLRSGSSDLAMAAAKLSVIDTLPVRVIGAVLNRVRGDGAFRYYTYGLKGYKQIEEENAFGPDGPIRVLGGRP